MFHRLFTSSKAVNRQKSVSVTLLTVLSKEVREVHCVLSLSICSSSVIGSIWRQRTTLVWKRLKKRRTPG